MFMIESKSLELLKDEIEAATTLIKESIEAKRPILIRHHADCDGYSGGIALEKAILPLIASRHKRESDIYYYYKRLPSKAPYYDYSDATKDVSMFLIDSARFERKKPLVIVVDNGSSRQDIMALKKLRMYGAKIIVIDHHPHSEENDKYTDLHINPHKVGQSSDLTAGMLGCEIAHSMMGRQDVLANIAALSAVSDHSFGEERPHYLAIAAESGYDEHRLGEISEAVDFEVHHIGFMESRGIIADLFFGPRMDELVKICHDEVQSMMHEYRFFVESYADIQEHHDRTIGTLDVSGIRGYPRTGKVLGLLSHHIKEKTGKPYVALGIAEDFISFRIGDELDVDVNKIISRLQSEIPQAMIDGGGHAKAGSMRFSKLAGTEIIQRVKELVK